MSKCRCGMINDSPLFWHVVNISSISSPPLVDSLLSFVVDLTCCSFIFFPSFSISIYSRTFIVVDTLDGWWRLRFLLWAIWRLKMWNVRKSIFLQLFGLKKYILRDSSSLMSSLSLRKIDGRGSRVISSCQFLAKSVRIAKKTWKKLIKVGIFHSRLISRVFEMTQDWVFSKISLLITISTCCHHFFGNIFMSLEASVNDVTFEFMQINSTTGETQVSLMTF